MALFLSHSNVFQGSIINSSGFSNALISGKTLIISILDIAYLSELGLKHSFMQSFFISSADLLPKLYSGQPGFCLKEPTALT